MPRTKFNIGDVFEIKTPIGLAYVQYTHDGEHMGQLVRVLPGTYTNRPLDFASFARQKELYFVFYTLEHALRAKQLEFVSHQPIPDWAKEFPIMRKRGMVGPEGGPINWTIGHGLRLYTVPDIQRAQHVRSLTAEQKKISIACIMPHHALVNSIVKGWVPERDEELNLAARRQEKEQERQQPPRGSEQSSSIEHFLYFPKKSQAEKAAQRLKATGWSVAVRMGADGENWLTLAKQPAPIEDDIESVRDELERLADELGGEYDGWGAAV